MKLSNAYVCFSCKEVSDGAPHGRCPVCNSDDVFPLGWFEYSEEERSRWFALIRPKHLAARNGAVDIACMKAQN
jgi:hypothetical protein